MGEVKVTDMGPPFLKLQPIHTTPSDKKSSGGGVVVKVQDNSAPFLVLRHLPHQLLGGNRLRVISDQVVSLVTTSGGFEIVTLPE